MMLPIAYSNLVLVGTSVITGFYLLIKKLEIKLWKAYVFVVSVNLRTVQLIAVRLTVV